MGGPLQLLAQLSTEDGITNVTFILRSASHLIQFFTPMSRILNCSNAFPLRAEREQGFLQN